MDSEDTLIKQVEQLKLGEFVEKHYKNLIEEGGYQRRGIEFMVKILTQKPRKM
jgi:hypothetical protein